MPRAEAEFKELMNVPRGFAHGGRVPIEQILVNLMPYAPLDVQITGKATHEEISQLKNYYFGAVCSALGVDPGRLNAAFNCGRACVEARRDQIKGALDGWSEVATRFRAASGVELVGAWGAPAAFRVNDVVKAGEQIMVAVPSEVMGFIPGGKFLPKSSLAEALAERAIRSEQVDGLLGAMIGVGAVAVRYTSGGAVEVIKIGIADNLSGVLFLAGDEPPPRVKSEHESGSNYVLVERLARGVYYFETR